MRDPVSAKVSRLRHPTGTTAASRVVAFIASALGSLAAAVDYAVRSGLGKLGVAGHEPVSPPGG